MFTYFAIQNGYVCPFLPIFLLCACFASTNVFSHKTERNSRTILTLWSRGIKCHDAIARCSSMDVILFILWLHSNISEQMDLGGSGSYSVLFLRLISILICSDVISFLQILPVLPSSAWSSGPASPAPEFSVTYWDAPRVWGQLFFFFLKRERI